MAGILLRFLLLALLFHKPGPRFNNSTDYASVSRGDADYFESSPLLSFDTILENGVNRFGHGLHDPKRPSDIYLEAFVEETSFVHDGRDSTPLPSAEGLMEIDSVEESVWPGLADIKPVLYQAQERLETYLRELLSHLGFGLGVQDHTTPCDIDQAETVVEETSFIHDSRDSTPLPSAEGLLEINSVEESVWPGFTDLKPIFHLTQERSETYLREILSRLGFGLGAQDHTAPCDTDQAETVLAETSFVHDGRDSTPLPSAEGLLEIDPVQESVWPGLADLRPVLYQTQERFHTYLRELLSRLGFGLGVQDHTAPCDTDQAETVLAETSFAQDGRDSTPLPSAEGLFEIDPVEESVWPGFTDLKPVLYQAQERFHTYLRELLSQLGFGLGLQGHTTPCDIDQAETVLEETSLVHDGRDSTPLPSAEGLFEIDPVEESVWPGFTDLKPVLYQAQERFHTYLRELLSQLGVGLGAQDHTAPCDTDQAETVLAEASFVHDGQDSTPLPSAEGLFEIDPVEESVWPGFTDLKPVLYQAQERFHTYLRELLSQLGFGLGLQGHTTPCDIDQAETVLEETSLVHDGRDSTPLPSAEGLFEIDPVEESVWPGFADFKAVLYQTQERFHTYLRELLSRLGFGLGAQDHTAPCDTDQAETVLAETSFAHDGRDSTPLPSAEGLSSGAFPQAQERFHTYLRELLSRLGFGLGVQDHTAPCDTDQAETVLAETSFVHDGRDSTPLPSAEGLMEIDSVQESVWPGFTDLKPVLYQAQERFHTYLRELLSQLGFGLDVQDHTTPCDTDQTEIVVEETSFVHDGRDSTPLPSAEGLTEIDPVEESVWPGFTDLRPVLYQAQERFHVYLREILNLLGVGLGAQDHTAPCDTDKRETVLAETSFVPDGRDSTPLSSAEGLRPVEIDPVQESVWPNSTALKSRFHLTLLIGSLSEAWLLDSALPEWSSQLLSFIMASVFIPLFFVKYAFRYVEKRPDPVCRKRLEQPKAAQPVLDRKPVEEREAAEMAHFMEQPMEFKLSRREIQEVKPQPAGPTLEQQRQDLDRRREEWESSVRAVEASLENTLKMINEWNTDLSLKMINEWNTDLSVFRTRIRSNQSRVTKLLTNQISPDRDASNQSKLS